MLSENDVSAVDSFIKDSGVIEMLEPWSRIKTALADSPATVRSPDLCDTCQNEGCRGVEIPYKGKWTMHACEGYTK